MFLLVYSTGVTWVTDQHCFVLAVLFYGLSSLYSIFLLRRGFREDNRINYCLLLVAFCFHTAAMFKRGFSLQRCPINNLYEATTFISWTIVTSYLLIGSWSRLRFLGAFASPLLLAIGVFALMPSLDVQTGAPNFTGGLASLHKALILLSFGAFGLSSIAGVMYLTQEHDLKYHKAKAILSMLPPIQRLEVIMGRLLAAGFCLLSAGLIVSSIFLKQTRNVYFTSDAGNVVFRFCLGALPCAAHFTLAFLPAGPPLRLGRRRRLCFSDAHLLGSVFAFRHSFPSGKITPRSRERPGIPSPGTWFWM